MSEATRSSFCIEAVSEHDPVWTAPAAQWREGLPLGNGQMGAVVWGSGPLRLTLVGDSTRSPQPLGDVELVPKGVVREATMRLRLADATADGRIVTGQGAIAWTSWVHAEKPLLVFELTAEREERGAALRLREPRQSGPEIAPALAATGFPPLERGETGETRWWRQRLPQGGESAIAWRVDRTALGRRQTLWLSIAQPPAGDSVARAAGVVQPAVEGNITGWRQPHQRWWAAHYQAALAAAWERPLQDRHWPQVYYLGAISRTDRPLLELPPPWPAEG